MTEPVSELARLRGLVDGLDAVIWEADASTGTFTFVSEGVRNVLGFAAADWLSSPTFWADHIHPEERRLMVGEFMRAATQAIAHDLEYRFLTGRGEYAWIRDVGHVVTDEHGVPRLIRGFMIDVTRSRQMGDQHRDAESRYRSLVEQLPAIVYIEDVEGEPDTPGQLLYVSPQVERILGYTPQEWLADPTAWRDSFHPDDVESTRQAAERAAVTGEAFSAEYRMLHRDGSVRWFRDEAVLMRDDRGRPVFWQGVMYDATAERASVVRADDTEARYRSLVEQLPAIVYTEPITAADPIEVTYISPQVERILGVTVEEWLRTPKIWLDSIFPEDRGQVEATNAEADRTHAPFVAEYRILGADGTMHWLHDEARVVRDEAGTPLMWQGVMVDVTEQRRAAELERDLDEERETAQHLRELDEMKNTFLQTVSHDLRTPLAAILGLAATIAREDAEMSMREAREMADRIVANARKLDRMVNDMLDLDRLSRGIVEPARRPVDVAALVRAIVEESEPLADRRVDLDTQPTVVPVDGPKVERIVENLLANTVRHTPATARVWVRVRPEDGGALIAVEDDGPGVPAELRDEVFEPFRRGPSAQERSPGVGVGLSLVARLAALHGGRAWVEERRGGGASFRVFLPASAPAGASDTGPPAPGSPADLAPPDHADNPFRPVEVGSAPYTAAGSSDPPPPMPGSAPGREG